MQIGIFDSGLGGLTVLAALRQALVERGDSHPAVDRLLYVADSGHAPYGEKPAAYVQARSEQVAGFLWDQGVDLLVIACNTATAVAARALREAHPERPIVGVEPGIKPAVGLTRNGRIGVMATEITLASEKFQLLAQAHAAHVELALQPCPGLAAAIETGVLDHPELLALVARYCAPLRQQAVDTVVLGCTHYPFIRHHLAREFGPGVTLVDTAVPVARHALDLLRAGAPHDRPATAEAGATADHAAALASPHSAPALHCWTSGDPAQFDCLLRLALPHGAATASARLPA